MANVTIVMGLTLASALCVVGATQAQTPQPATDKFFANVNVGGQLASADLTSVATKTIYEETATLTSTQHLGRGAVIDFGGGYRVWGDVFAGLVISHFGNTQSASTSASVPDPIFFNRPRVITGTTDDLKRSELNVAPHAVWVTPLTDKIDLAVAIRQCVDRLPLVVRHLRLLFACSRLPFVSGLAKRTRGALRRGSQPRGFGSSFLAEPISW